MRLISDSQGNYMTVIEEFVCKARPDSSSIYYIVKIGNNFRVYNNGSKRRWSRLKFINYLENCKTSHWRSDSIKQYYIELYQTILNSLIAIERADKLDKLFENKISHYILAC